MSEGVVLDIAELPYDLCDIVLYKYSMTRVQTLQKIYHHHHHHHGRDCEDEGDMSPQYSDRGTSGDDMLHVPPPKKKTYQSVHATQ